ncbi:MAG: glycosyltransferase family 39 protein, partial [Gemmatimonadaceae bacterium]|nr:glycosyltransferase family 39 protein [Chitinophagaceae bacterium]
MEISPKLFFGLAAVGILVNASGLLLPIMEPDGALYATIAKNMVLSGDYVNLMLEGNDWLDKPHLPFWITALSYNIFGINSFAYKLPAFLFWLAGAIYLFQFAKRILNVKAAQIAVLVYLSAEHLILSNNDVRAEPYLTGLIIAGTYHYFRGYTEERLTHFILGGFMVALGVMTKGPFFGIIVIGGLFTEWIIKKDWNQFRSYRLWISLLVAGVAILPELVSLYIQFDQHPEKWVFGRQQVSGIRFFFIDSQFGRFFNTGPIKGKGDPFFYLHTVLWAFLPWSITLVLYCFSRFRLKGYIGKPGLYLSGASALIGFVLFSLSGFQLPHYLNILFPYFSVIVASYLITMSGAGERAFKVSSTILFWIIAVGITALVFLLKPAFSYYIAILIFCTSIAIYALTKRASSRNIFIRLFLQVMLLNIFLNAVFYPFLFTFQSGMHAAKHLQQAGNRNRVYMFYSMPADYAFEFYSTNPILRVNTITNNQINFPADFFTTQSMADSLMLDNRYRIEILKVFDHFRITRLTGKFV